MQKRDYFGTVKQVELNDFWAAVLADDKCVLHPIKVDEEYNSTQEIKFPASDTEKGIV